MNFGFSLFVSLILDILFHKCSLHYNCTVHFITDYDSAEHLPSYRQYSMERTFRISAFFCWLLNIQPDITCHYYTSVIS